MAIGGKSRGNKRSSTSYASTITTVAFIALCVLGVWMLGFNSVSSPGTTTTRTATNSEAEANTAFSSSNEEQTTKFNDDKKEKTVFEDNPGQLPDDAIKSDEGKSQGDRSKDAATSAESKAKEQEVQDAGVVEESPKDATKAKESAEEQEKQKESETQLTEESTSTQNQQSEDQQTSQESSEQTQQQTENNQEANRYQDQTQGSGQQQQQGESEHTEESQDQQQAVKQQEQDVESRERSQESQDTTSKEDQQRQQQTQEISSNAFSDETREQKQQEFLTDTQTDQKENSMKPSKGQESLQKTTQGITKIQADHQNHETKEHDSTKEDKPTESNSGESLANTGIPKESTESKKSWVTQATQSENEKERRKEDSDSKESIYGYTWQLCNVTAGPDYIPCLDNEKALRQLHSTMHFEHRERHCPEEGPTCLVQLPEGYQRSVPWPKSRDKIWYHNVPHAKLAQVKGHQNWVKVTGEFLTFPGGGTQFIHGALHYIDFLQEAVPDIKWGMNTRVILDVGCGVASFGGYLFQKDVLTMSFAPKDEHEAQVQFALERGIPAISAVMGSQRLPFPSRVFDLVHCARCRVPWHNEGGLLLLELNRVLRPGGYFVWSATPVYQKLKEDAEIWQAMSALTASMCWELVTIKKDKLNSVGVAIYRKPSSNECYEKRKDKKPPMCKSDDDSNAAWYVPLRACMHRVPMNPAERGSRWPEVWPQRLQTPPYWLNSSQMGIYGKPAPKDFERDYEHWKRVVSKLYMSGLGISWSNVRNVMDMRAVYGGFAAAMRDLQVWVLNVVNIDSPDTLPIIYERGLFGIYHDWCESFSTYPRTYDLLHGDHLFSKLRKRCKLAPVMAEVDRIVRPGGKLIVRDESSTIGEVENLLKSLHWEVHLTFSKDQEGILSAQKGEWRPSTYQASS